MNGQMGTMASGGVSQKNRELIEKIKSIMDANKELIDSAVKYELGHRAAYGFEDFHRSVTGKRFGKAVTAYLDVTKDA